ncbi:MAG: hypothetical protein H0U74_15735 [Bradymonadaceae bacterium]|nr:hypothetical protein [Lujinxingiaceae bacterium]
MLNRKYICGFVLTASLLASACAGPERLQREGMHETLVVAPAWLRLPEHESEQVLFALAHRERPVFARLHKLEVTYISAALPVWATAWAAERFDAFDVTHAASGSENLHHLVLETQFGEVATTFDLALFNAGVASYMLEIWGAPEHVAALTATERGELAAGFDSSEAKSHPARSPAQAMQVGEAQGIGRGLGLDDTWRVDDQAGDLRFSLDARLIDGRAISEELPYALLATRYAEFALSAVVADPSRHVRSSTPRDQNTVDIVIDDTHGALPMVRVYRFVTHDKQAYQLIMSTPAALFETNAALIDTILDSFRAP